jgi:hypothetical protein
MSFEYPSGLTFMIDKNKWNLQEPYMIDTYSQSVIRVLRPKYHKWFKENNIWYNIEENFISGFSIFFKSKSDAILFKLTWTNI